MRWLLALALVASCGKNNDPPPPSSGVPGAKPESGPRSGGAPSAKSGDERAHAMFETICATCHGPAGQGNGPAAESLPTKPRNYTDAAWQASVTDEQIKNIIVHGGQAVGKSPLMPANPELERDTEKLDGLVKIIRAFGKK
ncbi:MAG TPA: c-type cytochrome [Kofleriaceae bacterium]|nr:c-type cytochrome [Kofleriaceae bacterium]